MRNHRPNTIPPPGCTALVRQTIAPSNDQSGPLGAISNWLGILREEKRGVAIASDESFSGWTETFTDPRLCAAIVDRLTFGGSIIETGTDSYRLATTGAQAERSPV